MTRRQVWPPSKLWFPPRTIMLGSLLGALEGCVIGGHYGDEYGIIAGTEIGALYGGLTGWAAGLVRSALSKNSKALVLSAGLWLLGGAVIGVSAAALAVIGDTQVFWSAPLPIFAAPLLLTFFAALIEAALAEDRGAALQTGEIGPFDLGAAGACHISHSARKFWSIVLSLAIRDKASEVRLEPQKDGYSLRYRVDGTLIDMVPPPTSLLTVITAEIRTLAGLGASLPFLRDRLRRFPFLPLGRSRSGILCIRIGEVSLQVRVFIQPTRNGECVVLEIPDDPMAPTHANATLQRLLIREPAPDTGINHVCQGTGNCAVATVAMIGRVSYEEVAACRHSRRAPRTKEILALLARFTGVRWQSVSLHSLPRRLDRIAFPPWPVVVYIRPPWQFRVAHCIAVEEESVHDPAWTRAVRLDHYDRGYWRVTFIAQPVSPEA
jgi:hypothetical protein